MTGAFSGSVSLNPNTVNHLDITTTDLGNNTSTGTMVITHDSILPTVVLNTSSGVIVDSANFLVDGITEMNATVSITNQSGSVVGNSIASSTGAFSISATLLQDSVNVLTVTATDAAGNQ